MATIQDLTAAVAAESTLEDSIISMLNGIVQQLKDAQTKDALAASAATPGAPVTPPASTELDAVIASIQANTDKMKAAITANTPVVVVPVGSTVVPSDTPVTVAPPAGVTQDGVTPAVVVP